MNGLAPEQHLCMVNPAKNPPLANADSGATEVRVEEAHQTQSLLAR